MLVGLAGKEDTVRQNAPAFWAFERSENGAQPRGSPEAIRANHAGRANFRSFLETVARAPPSPPCPVFPIV